MWACAISFSEPLLFQLHAKLLCCSHPLDHGCFPPTRGPGAPSRPRVKCVSRIQQGCCVPPEIDARRMTPRGLANGKRPDQSMARCGGIDITASRKFGTVWQRLPYESLSASKLISCLRRRPTLCFFAFFVPIFSLPLPSVFDCCLSLLSLVYRPSGLLHSLFQFPAIAQAGSS